MKWIAFAAGLLVGLIAVMAGVGALLPRAHRATRRARYRQPPEAIWAVIAGPPDWQPHAEKVPFEVVEERAPLRRVTRIADPNLPYGGTWTYEIEPAPGGAWLRITENGEVYNPIFRFLSRFVFGHTGTMETYLRDLGGLFREKVRIEE